MKSLVSVIMPVYNGGLYLAEAIRSVLRQSHDTWELIIVNDGSTDNSEEIINQFIDDRIIYIRSSRQGVSSARNTGLFKMRGDFFCFLDADDILTDNSIESRLKIFNDEIDFVDGSVKVFNSDFSKMLACWSPKVKGEVMKHLIDLSGNCFFGPTWMIKVNKSVTYRMNEKLKYGEDLIFYSSIANSGNYSYTTDTILAYRKHGQSAMSNIEGLANGYYEMRRILYGECKIYFTFTTRLKFDFRSRKVIFLEFLKARKYKLGFIYLIKGTV